MLQETKFNKPSLKKALLMNKYIKTLGFALLCVSIQSDHSFSQEELSQEIKALLKVAYEENDIKYFEKTLTLLMETQPKNKDALQNYANGLQIFEKDPTSELKNTHLETEKGKIFDLSAWGASAEFGFSASSGDNSEQSLALGMSLSRFFSKKWDHAFDIDIDFAKANGVTSKEKYFADYQLFYRAREKAYAFVFVQAEHDKFSGFDYQISESIGIGYTVLDNEKHKWSFEGGPGVRQNKLTAGVLDNEFIFLLNNKYRHIFTNSLSAGNETKIFIGSTRFTTDNVFDVIARFNSKLSAHFSFQYKYDSNVPIGRTNSDTLTKATLVYDF